MSSAGSAGWMSRRGFLAAAMALAAPLAFFGLLGVPNSYQAMGIEGAVDCDGPLGVLVFAVPALLVYAPGFVLFARSAAVTRRAVPVLVAIVSGLVCVGLGANAVSALAEHARAEHRAACGEAL